MHLKKWMQPWLVFLIPINAVFTIRLEVNKLLNSSNLEVEVRVTIHFKADIITDFRVISLHQKIYLTIFFTELKSQEEAMLQCKGEDSNNNSNNIDRGRKKKCPGHKYYLDNLDHYYSCYCWVFCWTFLEDQLKLNNSITDILLKDLIPILKNYKHTGYSRFTM